MPDDDAPRLAYADWLERDGDLARAEFIRLQCWLSAMPESHWDWEQNWKREQELLRANVVTWSMPFANVTYWGHDLWDRGFLSFLGVYRPGDFARWAEYFASVTATDRLVIGWTLALEDDVETLIGCPELAGVRELWTNDEGGTFPPDKVSDFLQAPFAQNLTRLSFGGSQWRGHHECELLTTEPLLPHLRYLACAHTSPVRVETVIGLLRSPFRQNLRGLETWGMDETDVEALCACPELSRLTHLDFGSCYICDGMIRRLVECPYLERIEYLSLDGDCEESATELSLSARAAFFERFGDRGNLSEMPYVGGPEREMHRWRLVTGRPR